MKNTKYILLLMVFLNLNSIEEEKIKQICYKSYNEQIKQIEANLLNIINKKKEELNTNINEEQKNKIFDSVRISIIIQTRKMNKINKQTVDRFFSTSKQELNMSKLAIDNQDNFMITNMSEKLKNHTQSFENRLRQYIDYEINKIK